MAYPTNSLGIVLEEIDRTAIALKATLQAQISTMAAGNVPSSLILGVYARLHRDDEQFESAAATPGIVEYARTVKNDAELDVAAEFTALRSAIATAVAWIETNFPAASGYLQSHSFSNSEVVERQFTPAQTAGFRTVLQSIVSAIN